MVEEEVTTTHCNGVGEVGIFVPSSSTDERSKASREPNSARYKRGNGRLFLPDIPPGGFAGGLAT